jgi:hypothetical protein
MGRILKWMLKEHDARVWILISPEFISKRRHPEIFYYKFTFKAVFTDELSVCKKDRGVLRRC